jgi:hypothetical protein
MKIEIDHDIWFYVRIIVFAELFFMTEPIGVWHDHCIRASPYTYI